MPCSGNTAFMQQSGHTAVSDKYACDIGNHSFFPLHNCTVGFMASWRSLRPLPAQELGPFNSLPSQIKRLLKQALPCSGAVDLSVSGNGRKPPPPHTMCHTPHWASAGRVAFYYFVFLKRRKCIRGHFLVGHPQASARALADM